MKTRRVFSTPDLPAAQRAMDAARVAGIADDDISLVARSDIEMDKIPDDRLDASSDFVGAALRGAGAGGVMGVIGGLIAVAIPPIGITVAGAALIALASSAVAGWSGALAGSAVPSPVRRKFEQEIEAGRILVVIDGAASENAHVDAAVTATGAVQLPFEELSILV
ncbi:MAG: hypothetical protein ABIS07_10680 [Dokdonella sp.]